MKGLGAALLGWLIFAPFAAAAPAAGPQSRLAPPIFALVIGIDAYRNLPPLKGAVNDAAGIARALTSVGAREVRTLTNGQATRAAIVSSIKELGQRAGQAGGWLIISYAGHGGQEPERVPGDEEDGKDEVLLLAGFSTGPSGNGERLVDNEIYTLLSGVPANVKVLFVADACHSGTLTRSIDTRGTALGTRLARYGPIIADTLPPPPAASLHKNSEDLPNVVFVASSRDSEVTPELLISGVPHGAVSWAMAQAFAGDADLNEDGVTDLAELRQYIVNSVRLVAENRQTPAVQFLAGRSRDAFPMSSALASTLPSSEGTETKVFVLGDRKLPSIHGIVAATTRNTAEIIWDPKTGDVISNATGDKIAEQGKGQDDATFLAGVVDKIHALMILRPIVTRIPLSIEIGPRGAGVRYASGTVDVSIEVPAGRDPHFITIFNIAGDGTVQLLFPDPRKPTEGEPWKPGSRIDFSSVIRTPFGADHIVAIDCSRDPAALRQQLTALDGRSAAREAVEEVATERDRETAVGMVGIFSGPQ